MKLSFLTAGIVSILSSLAFAETEAHSAKFSYERNYESDSGWADINECVRNKFTANGTFVGSEIVHDWVSNPGEANIFCAGLSRSEQSSTVYLLSKNETVCHAVIANGTEHNVAMAWCGR